LKIADLKRTKAMRNPKDAAEATCKRPNVKELIVDHSTEQRQVPVERCVHDVPQQQALWKLSHRTFDQC
jgi:hypothetical protein